MLIDSIKSLLTHLDYEVPKRFVVPKCLPFALNGLTVVTEADGKYKISSDSNEWALQSKIKLDDKQLTSLANLVARFAPPSSIVSLQPDTHAAGDVFVGMVMSWNNESIPINLISGDIGCGLTVLPFRGDMEMASTEEDFSHILATIRQSLKRGVLAESGQSLNEFTKEASEFYGESELSEWLDEMHYVLSAIGVKFDDQRDSVLKYIAKYAQSLGSSGNHFMEISEDDWCNQWMVIHSGSRGLGAEVYSAMAGACRFVNKGYEVATGNLATFYTRAYDALNKFAKLNRVICGIVVLKNLGYTYRAHELKAYMEQSPLFKDAINACPDSDMPALIGGLTHNGLKAFINRKTREVLYVLCKGSIALTKRASSAIVALRAGDGCYAWTMVDPTCDWEETTIKQALWLNFKVVYEADGVIYCGHGAGRSQSTRETSEQSTFKDVMAFYDEVKIVGNLAPGVLGDNPRIAYKDTESIIKELPRDIACTKSQLRTLVSYKEGISYNGKINFACAEYIKSVWPNLSDHRKLWMDLNLCRIHITTDKFESMKREVFNIQEAYLAKKCGLT